MPDTVAGRLAILGASASERWHRALGRFSSSPGLVRVWAPPSEESSGLVMSDVLVLAGLALALFIAMDPFTWRLGRIAATKHVPLALVGGSLLLVGLGQRIFGRPRQDGSLAAVVSATKPLVLLAVFIVAGSVYARTVGKIENGFLSFGLYIFAMPGLAYWVCTSRAPEKLVRGYFALVLVASISVVCLLVANYGVRGMFHELEFIFLPMIAFFFALRKYWFFRVIAVALCLAAAWLVHKNTAYLIVLMSVIYSAWAGFIKANSGRRGIVRVVTLYLVVLSSVGLVAAALGAWTYRDILLPSGNPQFRLLTYARAWHDFLSSPLWGTAFTSAASVKFEGFDTGVARNILPTHSDILDLLAGGGAIAIALWLWGLCRIGRFVGREVLTPGGVAAQIVPQVHWLAVSSLAAIITYAFNPILLQPALALITWANMGLLVGLVCRVRRERKVGEDDLR